MVLQPVAGYGEFDEFGECPRYAGLAGLAGFAPSAVFAVAGIASIAPVAGSVGSYPAGSLPAPVDGAPGSVPVGLLLVVSLLLGSFLEDRFPAGRHSIWLSATLSPQTRIGQFIPGRCQCRIPQTQTQRGC